MGSDETLAWEARRRPRAALAAVLASVLILGSYVVEAVLLSDSPLSSGLQAISAAGRPGPVGEAQSLTVPRYEYLADRSAGLIAAYAARALGFLFLGLALTFLAFATRARLERLGRAARYLPLVGGVLLAVGNLIAPIGTVMAVDEFLDGPRTVDAARGVVASPLTSAASLMDLLGRFTTAGAFILVCLNAMRAGLLTRFLGVLGIFCGPLFVIELASPLPVVQCFWLAALAWLLLGRWPGGDPPAWRTGEAVPWPTQQELREARERAAQDHAHEPGRGGREPVAVGAGAAQPGSRKKKRKRRG